MSRRKRRKGILSARASFLREIVEPIQVDVQGHLLTYEQYLELPESERSDDEAAVVDQQFTRRLLEWLGYEESDWTYNRATGGSAVRPDFRVAPGGVTAFVVEDKNTTERFAPSHVEQMRRYVAGTAGYALWTNGRELVGVRIPPQGDPELLARLQVVAVPALTASQEAGFELLKTLFSRARYTELPRILERICVEEDAWQRVDIAEPGAREQFIAGTRSVLEELSIAARADIDRALVSAQLARQDLEEMRHELRAGVDRLVADLKKSAYRPSEIERLEDELHDIVANPLVIDEEVIEEAKPKSASFGANELSWEQWKRTTLNLMIAYRELDLQWAKSRRITTAAQIWKARHRVIETAATKEADRLNAYSEQVAYTFFVRLLLARILEDRKLLPRIISNGGLAQWRKFLRASFFESQDAGELLPNALLSILYRSVSRCYRHFFNQPVFDWFEPDEYLLARVLDVFGSYDFGNIREDILGFTYEAYIDEVARSKKGHFLTRPELVELILSEAGYEGRAIVGKQLLDPAAGSGSFLVHAARRLRRAIFASEGLEEEGDGNPAARLRASQAFLEHLERDLVGLEINPFSCYLAELNLYIQALDDVLYIFRTTGKLPEIERFRIYNTNSLELPRHVLYETAPSLELHETALDEAWDVKSGGDGLFHFVIGNPPYVNRGIVTDAPSYDAIPFFRSIQSGDANTFLLFLRLGLYYTSPQGVVSYVIPINLLGDTSGQAARGSFDSKEWHVERIVRFYRREVLFEGVLQRVCVFTARRSAQPPERILLRGGKTVDAAEATGASLRYDVVTKASANHGGSRWKGAWLCVPEEFHYRIWEHLRGAMRADLEQFINKRIVFQQGDVNKTRTKVYRTSTSRESTLPITCGAKVKSFGPWEVDVHIDPAIDARKAGLEGTRLRDAERELAGRIERIRELDHEEAVFCLKDVVGMEAIRPIRGSLYRRGAGRAFLFDHTLQIAYATSEADNDLVRALFGILVSAVPGYILQLFSTNAHVTTNELLRTPLPDLTETDLGSLARAAVALQEAGEKLHASLARCGGKLWLAEISIDARHVLSGFPRPTSTLDDAVRRGVVTAPRHPDWKVDRLIRAGELQAEGHPDLQKALELLGEGLGRRYAEVRGEARLPSEEVAADFLEEMTVYRQDCETLYQTFLEARAVLDRIAFRVYGIESKEWQRAVIRGVPWAVEGREETERLERILFG